MFYSSQSKRSIRSRKGDDILEIQPLGAGSEVGRSAHLLRFKGKQVLLDCGIHPGLKGINSLPFFDSIDPSEIDLILISHFHIDHCGALPYFLEHTNFKGQVYMTNPTKAIITLLLKDFTRVSEGSEEEERLFDDNDLKNMEGKIHGMDYHQEKKMNGIKFWCYNAGHVLGAAMFMVEIAGVRVLYSGDYSPVPDRHLVGAEIPKLSPNVFLVESTYGTQTHGPREKRELRFKGMVYDIVRRGGKCLIPVFALGRAQELLLILDEYWSKRPELKQKIPIYYASALAEKCMSIYHTYSNTMNESVRNQIDTYNRNPFAFRNIKKLRKASDIKNREGPCVVLASPGMLQSGMSRELYEAWCGDERNGIIVTGYCVEGTPARTIQSEPNQVILSTGEAVDFKASVKTISFSAHSDCERTTNFIEKIMPEYVVLIHGSSKSGSKLKTFLEKTFIDTKMQIFQPRNTDRVRIEFKREKVGKMIGKLARSFKKELNDWNEQWNKKEKEEEKEEKETKKINIINEFNKIANERNDVIKILDSGTNEDEDDEDDDDEKKKNKQENDENDEENNDDDDDDDDDDKAMKDEEKKETTKKKKMSIGDFLKRKKEKMEDENDEEENKENGEKKKMSLSDFLKRKKEVQTNKMEDEEKEEIKKEEKEIKKEEEEVEERKEEEEEEKEAVITEEMRERQISGILLSKDFQTHLVNPSDLKKYFGIPTTGVQQKLILPFSDISPWSDYKQSLGEFWEKKLKELVKFPFQLVSSLTSSIVFSIEGTKIIVKIDKKKPGEIVVSWNASKTCDTIVDFLSIAILNENNKKLKQRIKPLLDEREKSMNIPIDQRLEKLKYVLACTYDEDRIIAEKDLLILKDCFKQKELMKVGKDGKMFDFNFESQEEEKKIRKLIHRVFIGYNPFH